MTSKKTGHPSCLPKQSRKKANASHALFKIFWKQLVSNREPFSYERKCILSKKLSAALLNVWKNRFRDERSRSLSRRNSHSFLSMLFLSSKSSLTYWKMPCVILRQNPPS